eukprot:TRINITY_DN20996_c0_g1_i1.p1 TRINITY_DN20996_c0_g1~~TRINITY_DN20996_c0_g1_i1.p1  ORF type:complete len:526 (-),score=101.02 TRINITY_DN20996_c0_g1_i1:165-1673(-)
MASSNIYVSGLLDGSTEDTLRDLFSTFGTIESIKVVQRQGAVPCYGFVKMATPTMASYALDGLRGCQLEGSSTPLTVRLANNEPGAKGAGKSAPPLVGGGTNVYIAGIPEEVSEDELRGIWSQYGTIMQTKLSDQSKGGTRYAFVNYSTPSEAEYAISQTNGTMIGSGQLQVRLASNAGGKGSEKGWSDKGSGKGGDMGFNLPGMALASAFLGAAKGGQQMAPPSDNLYIKGLPPGITEAAVTSTFTNYGTVVQCKVMDQQQGNPCVAMVRMSSVDEAAWVKENLDGNIPHGLDNIVSVNFATSNSKGSKGKGAPAALEATNGSSYGAWDNGSQGAGKGVVIRPSPYGSAKGGSAKGNGWMGDDGQAAAQQPRGSAPSAEMMTAVSETVEQIKGYMPAAPAHAEDPRHLHIKGLASDIDDLWLYYVFAPFGGVTSVILERDDASGNCTGEAFVKYGLPEDAQLAMETISGNPLPDGSVIEVTVKSGKGGGKGKFKVKGKFSW